MAGRPRPNWMDANLLDEDEEVDQPRVPSRPRAAPPPPPPATAPPLPPPIVASRERHENFEDAQIQQSSPSPEPSAPVIPPLNSRKYERLQARIGTTVKSRSPSGVSIPVAGSRVVIAIDYGTTYTGLAIALTDSDHAILDEIQVLRKWGPNGSNIPKVRTMISYIKSATGQTQWGSAVSNHATAMINTKLELEPQPSRRDELELTLYLLLGTGNLAFDHLKKIGPNPAYTSAPPRQVVQDYLTHIRECACQKGAFKTDLSKLVETKTPIDVVVTVPAKWSFEATDATFKAVRGAGFNAKTFPTLRDTILISEPEAASFFAIRDFQATINVDLRVDDCFILCDAGGGTVDVVSYQVKKVQPDLQIERATDPDSRKCGSAFVDTAFKNWLRDILGPEDYGKIDPLNTEGKITAFTMENGYIRELVEAFIEAKQAFSEESGDIRLDLPEPLKHLDLPGRVEQGELTIYRREMEKFFDWPIEGCVELLEIQVEKLKVTKNRKARNVFLVGGFGASLYLQHNLEVALGLRKGSTLRRPDPDKSLTAVVQGAVIHGIEKSRHGGIKLMTATEDSYGICQNGRFEWLIREGDLILSTEKKSVVSKNFSLPLRSCPNRRFEVTIYKFLKRDDDEEPPDSWEDGQHDVASIGVIRCDVSEMLERELRVQSHQQGQGDLEIGPFKCHLQLSEECLDAEVTHKKRVLSGCKISTKADGTRNVQQSEWS